MKQKKLNRKGFTLIEVVLVLAIGGLIFLLAFLAFQQTSRNRRDTQRRADASRVIAELQNYSSDNSGSYPSASAAVAAGSACTATSTASDFVSFMATYICDSSTGFKSPSGSNYAYVTAITAKDQMKFSTGACTGSSGSHKVEVGLDNGSTYCRSL